MSEQQWVDCDDICFGCNGGLEVFAFRYAKFTSIVESKDYPYVEKVEDCQVPEYSTDGPVRSDKWVELYPGVESELKVALETAPTCVSVNASNLHF